MTTLIDTLIDPTELSQHIRTSKGSYTSSCKTDGCTSGEWLTSADGKRYMLKETHEYTLNEVESAPIFESFGLPVSRVRMVAETSVLIDHAENTGEYELVDTGYRWHVYSDHASAERMIEDAMLVVSIDMVLNNQDRHGGNWLIVRERATNELRIMPIDHERLSSYAEPTYESYSAGDVYIDGIPWVDMTFRRICEPRVERFKEVLATVCDALAAQYPQRVRFIREHTQDVLIASDLAKGTLRMPEDV